MSNSPAEKSPDGLRQALQAHLSTLTAIELPANELDQRAAAALAVLVTTLKKVELSLQSQLEVLGKNHPRIKSMAESLQQQNLLNVEEVIKSVLSSPTARMSRLQNYSDLLLRWWSAVLAGVQTTILEVPHELTESLNPTRWELEKKRWGSEEAAYWEHFKFVIRPELPLKVGDKMKSIQAEKTLDAYAILGGDKR